MRRMAFFGSIELKNHQLCSNITNRKYSTFKYTANAADQFKVPPKIAPKLATSIVT